MVLTTEARPKTAINKTRSPSYPAIGLKEAIERVGMLYEKAQRTSVIDRAAVGAMGYGALSGAARVLLSALRKYGLIEGQGKNVRVSELALRILVHPEGSEDRNAAIRAAAFKPDIFKELAPSYARVADDMLRAYLLSERKFSRVGAEQFIPAFRETLALVARLDGGYDADMTAGTTPNVIAPMLPAGTPGIGRQQQPPRPFNLLIDDETSVEMRVLGGNGTLLGLSAGQLGTLIDELSSLKKRLLDRKPADA